MHDSSDFQSELDRIFNEARSANANHVDVISGDLHRRVGGYPDQNHRMPVCCHVMRSNMKEGDSVLDEPPKGQGATLKIRYKIPR